MFLRSTKSEKRESVAEPGFDAGVPMWKMADTSDGLTLANMPAVLLVFSGIASPR